MAGVDRKFVLKGPATVILTHAYWQSKFGSDASAVGRSLTLDGQPREIIGVLPAGFRFLDLDFIFQIVLSLFAILFAYDTISGEKERGTLRPWPDFSDSSSERNSTSPFTAN